MRIAIRLHGGLDSGSIAEVTAVKGNSHLFALPALISLKHMPDELFLMQAPTYIRSASNTAFWGRILASFGLSEYVEASVFRISSLSIAFLAWKGLYRVASSFRLSKVST